MQACNAVIACLRCAPVPQAAIASKPVNAAIAPAMLPIGQRIPLILPPRSSNLDLFMDARTVGDEIEVTFNRSINAVITDPGAICSTDPNNETLQLCTVRYTLQRSQHQLFSIFPCALCHRPFRCGDRHHDFPHTLQANYRAAHSVDFYAKVWFTLLERMHG